MKKQRDRIVFMAEMALLIALILLMAFTPIGYLQTPVGAANHVYRGTGGDWCRRSGPGSRGGIGAGVWPYQFCQRLYQRYRDNPYAGKRRIHLYSCGSAAHSGGAAAGVTLCLFEKARPYPSYRDGGMLPADTGPQYGFVYDGAVFAFLARHGWVSRRRLGIPAAWA